MAQNIWKELSNQMREVAASAGRSVVAVHGRRHPSSGIVWSSDVIVTASHALRRDEEITVIFSPEEKTTGRVAGRDASTDLAVVRLDQPLGKQLTRWGETASLRVGELVLALGRTWRGNLVGSSGILSGLMGPWRALRGGQLDQYIRPDLVFYPGFSGGPLVNSDGEILGLNTAGLHRSGITVPAGNIRRVVTELLEKGRIEKPYLGLAMQAVPLPESLRTQLNLSSEEGLLVAHVEPGSPAEKAGLLLGDVLIELNGQAVTDTGDVQDVLRTQKAGNSVVARLLRAGKAVSATIVLAARP